MEQKEKNVKGMFFESEDDELWEIEEHDTQSPRPNPAQLHHHQIQVKLVLHRELIKKIIRLIEVYNMVILVEIVDCNRLFCLLSVIQ